MTVAPSRRFAERLVDVQRLVTGRLSRVLARFEGVYGAVSEYTMKPQRLANHFKV